MRKISIFLTLILFLFLAIGCSNGDNGELNLHIEEIVVGDNRSEQSDAKITEASQNLPLFTNSAALLLLSGGSINHSARTWSRLESVSSEGVILENSLLIIQGWIIECFELLEKFNGIRALEIRDSHIPQGVTIPPLGALESLTYIELGGIYGSGAADILVDLLPLPNLRTLVLSGDVPSQNSIPHIPSLIDLYVVTPDTICIIQNNNHIAGILHLGSACWQTVIFGLWGGEGNSEIKTLEGIENFTNIVALSLSQNISDLSPLANLKSLRILDITASKSIDSLMPLYGLQNLQEILMTREAHNALPPNEQELFNPRNNRCYYAVHVYFYRVYFYYENYRETTFPELEEWRNFEWYRIVSRTQPHSVIRTLAVEYLDGDAFSDFFPEIAMLSISGLTIKSFEFLRHFPRLTHLIIDDSVIESFDFLDVYGEGVLSIALGQKVGCGLTLPFLPNLIELSIRNCICTPIIMTNNNHIYKLSLALNETDENIDFLTNFNSLISLRIMPPLGEYGLFALENTLDLSAITNMRNLRLLSVDPLILNINSLEPLSNLTRLRDVWMFTRFYGIPHEHRGGYLEMPRYLLRFHGQFW